MLKPAPPTLVRYHHGDLRAALIEAAERLLIDQGNWTFTLREVARAAGVSHNAPYNHFEDKRALLAAVATRAFAVLGDALSQGIADLDKADAAARIEAAAVCYVQFAVDQPARFRLMFSAELAEAATPELDTASAAAFDTLRALIAQGVDAGELRPDPQSTHALSAWSLVHGLSSLILDKRAAPGVDRAAIAELAAVVGRDLIEGLRARRPGVARQK